MQFPRCASIQAIQITLITQEKDGLKYLFKQSMQVILTQHAFYYFYIFRLHKVFFGRIDILHFSFSPVTLHLVSIE